ncbi:FtsX-like permease family protein [Pseudokineococcus sp. 1T1Z-3]|uniref:FtsX-like permease family protein n=1 Tax=Pseudokineococcus sp. 1T1Z-3 TaxID=3132745 RepID=UPI0030B36902
MLRLSLAQIRHTAGRLLASATAVVIAVAFVVVTLVGGATSTAGVRGALAAPYVGADLVVKPSGQLPPGSEDDPFALPPSLAGAADAVRGVDGVAAVAVDPDLAVELAVDDASGSTYVSVQAVEPPGSPLRWQHVSAGRLPERLGEIAVSDRVAAAVGDVVTVVPPTSPPTGEPTEGSAAEGSPEPPTHPAEDVEVVGVLDTDGDPQASLMPQAAVTSDQAAAWAVWPAARLRVAAAPGTGTQALSAAVTQVAGKALGVPVTTSPAEEVVDRAVDEQTGGALELVALLLAFAVVALLVAGLVIANTFAVLLAQRTRELALLRCVGASRAQVRRGVLAEALVAGLVASALGTAAGVALVATGLAVAGRLDLPVPLADLAVPWWAVLAGMATGTLVTVLAATSPARAATRVSPLAAMRPLDKAPLRSGGGLLRLVLGLVLLVPGAAVLAVASARGELVLGVAAGVPTFLGVVLLCHRVVPPVVGLAGRLAARLGGVPGRVAAGNAVRVPRRTAATATALLVGVTLVSTFLVGAASTRATVTERLAAQYPADVVVLGIDLFLGDDGSEAGLPAELAPQVGDVDGVTRASEVTGAEVDLDGLAVTALGLDAGTDAVVRSPSAVAPADGEVRVGPGYASLNGLTDGQVVVATGAAGSADLVVRVGGSSDWPVVATAQLDRLAGTAPVVQVWGRLADPDGAGTLATVDAVGAVATEAVPGAVVQGAALVRQGLDDVLETLLLVVTGLLGVAVVIALVGVGSTLSLSVVERRQEIGLLRALGLPASGVRRTLLWEAGLVAGVASVLGVALGVVFGVAGTSAALASEASVVVDVPWLRVLAVVAAATTAGMLASALPARRAGCIPPVAAMAA